MEIAIQNSEASLVDLYWDKLRTLSRKARLNLASRLTISVLEEETETPFQRKAKVKKAYNSPTDDQLEAIMIDRPMPEVHESEDTWDEVINANIGKTIKPIEKWL